MTNLVAAQYLIMFRKKGHCASGLRDAIPVVSFHPPPRGRVVNHGSVSFSDVTESNFHEVVRQPVPILELNSELLRG